MGGARAFALGPFAGAADLPTPGRRGAPRRRAERQLALIRAHPDLGGRAAGRRADASAREQASAGLDRLSAKEPRAGAALNDAYRERFGFPFVVCVREHSKESILQWGEQRLGHERDEEVEIALDEIAKIALLRLRELDA